MEGIEIDIFILLQWIAYTFAGNDCKKTEMDDNTDLQVDQQWQVAESYQDNCMGTSSKPCLMYN